MNKLLLITVIIGILAIFIFSTINIVKANIEKTENKATTQISSCTDCQNKCTAENNCGVPTCQARSGKTCGCK